jgi:hypothetical protein
MRRHATACLLGRSCKRQRASLHNALTDAHQGGMHKAEGEVRADNPRGKVTEATLNTCMRCTFYTRPAAVGVAQRFVK